MAITDNFTPNIQNGSVGEPPVRDPLEITADGAITRSAGLVWVDKDGVCAMTLDVPAIGMEGAELVIVARTANAHTITQSSPGFNSAGTAGDVATFGGAIGDAITLRADAVNGVWYTVSLNNVTLG